MSSTNVQTQYQFQISTGNNLSSNVGAWEADSTLGMTDELANQIVQAIKAITPPPGVTINATVTKQDVTQTSYTTNYSTSPITFT